MSLRIAQQLDVRDYDVLDFTLSKNGNVVTTTGKFTAVKHGEVWIVAARLVITSVPDSTGNWVLSVPDLLFADQQFGFWMTSTTSTPAKLSAGNITPFAQPTMALNSYFTIQGTVC